MRAAAGAAVVVDKVYAEILPGTQTVGLSVLLLLHVVDSIKYIYFTCNTILWILTDGTRGNK